MDTVTNKKRTTKKAPARKKAARKPSRGGVPHVGEIALDTPGGTSATIYTPPSPAMTVIEKLLASPNENVETIERMLAVQERWEDREALKAYNVAFAKFKSMNIGTSKTQHVNYTAKSKHGGDMVVDYWHDDVGVTLHKVSTAMGPLGLSIRYTTKNVEGLVFVAAICGHILGHSERCELAAPPDNTGGKNAIQAVGSTIRYLQRYTLNMLLGLAPPGDPSEENLPISADDIKAIYDALEEKQADNPEAANWSTERFCNWLGVTSVEGITRKQYRRASMQLGIGNGKAADLDKKTRGKK